MRRDLLKKLLEVIFTSLQSYLFYTHSYMLYFWARPFFNSEYKFKLLEKKTLRILAHDMIWLRRKFGVPIFTSESDQYEVYTVLPNGSIVVDAM